MPNEGVSIWIVGFWQQWSHQRNCNVSFFLGFFLFFRFPDFQSMPIPAIGPHKELKWKSNEHTKPNAIIPNATWMYSTKLIPLLAIWDKSKCIFNWKKSPNLKINRMGDQVLPTPSTLLVQFQAKPKGTNFLYGGKGTYLEEHHFFASQQRQLLPCVAILTCNRLI